MMRYKIYSTLVDSLMRNIRKRNRAEFKKLSRLSYRDRTAHFLSDFFWMAKSLNASPTIINGELEFNRIVYSNELAWNFCKRPTIFMPKDIASWLLGCGSDVAASDIEWPKQIPGGSACLCVEGEEPFLAFFAKDPSDLWELPQADRTAFPILMLLWNENRVYYFQKIEGDDDAKSFLNDESGREEIISEDPWYKYTDDEKAKKQRLFKLILNTLCYINAFPECLTDGFPPLLDGAPVGSGFRLEAHASLRKKESDRHEVAAHLRRGHFRALRNEKFKRDDSGSVRIIYVKASLVHREQLTPMTVGFGAESANA